MKRTTAANSSGGAHVDRVAGVSAGTLDIAEDRNNLQEEVCHPVELLGVALDGTDQYQLEKAIIGLSKPVGEVFDMAIEEEPVAWASARNNAAPSGARYFPAVKLWDDDHVLDVTNYPLLVPKLRAEKAKSWSGSAFVTDHSVTVSSSTITGSGTAWDYLVAAIAEDALKLGSYKRTINVNGTDYAITAASTGSHTLTVTGTPSSGAQTAIMYPYRIDGSATTAKIFKDSGSASMTPDGIRYVGGLQARDRVQGFGLSKAASSTTPVNGNFSNNYVVMATTPNTAGQTATFTTIVTDGTNGTPRTGLTTEPNAAARCRYMWASVLL